MIGVKSMRVRASVLLLSLVLVLVTLASACAATPPAPANPPATPPSEPAKPVAPATITTVAVTEKKPEVDINLKIPVISGLPDKALETRLNAQFDKEARDQARKMHEMAVQHSKEAAASKIPFRPYAYYYNYSVSYNRNGLLSLTIQGYQYTGGAHGLTSRVSYTYDLVSSTRLGLADLFRPNVDYKTPINAEISRSIALRPREFFEGKEGFNGIKPDQSFYLSNAGIVVCFGQYEIAPYSTGMPEFAFKASALQSLLKETYGKAITSEYEASAGSRFQIKSYKILSNTPEAARITFDVSSLAGAWDAMRPQVNVLTAEEPVFAGESKSRDDTLGKFRVEVLFSDTGLQEQMRKVVGLKTQRLASGGELLQFFRVAYPPDDSAMVFYLGCNNKPQVTINEEYGRITIELTK